ncbi:MAG: V-type ATP synthase subunit I, partial [Clostridia bacterium]
VPVLGVIVAAPIFLGGHLFNIGINTLGTYVHDSRLHFIEFFSKFYEGGGHQFIPLGSNTKYTYIEK